VSKLELTWIGKEKQISPEMGILIKREDLCYGEKSSGNLLIHGDNLFVLKSLEQDFVGKIKCIYIDPPYNTGSAFEHYDDNLEHIAWLGLMKPRLEMLRNLLRDDGVLFVHIDNKESAYLKVLCDEIFGRSNFISTFSIKVRHSDRMLKGDKDIHDVVENIHFYQKTNEFKIKKRSKNETEEDILREYIWDIVTLSEGVPIMLAGRECVLYPQGHYELVKKNPNALNLKKISIRGSLREGNSSGRFFVANLENRINIDGFNALYKVPNMGDDHLGFRFFLARENQSKKNGHYLQGKPITKITAKEQPYPSFFDFSTEFNRVGYEGVVEFRNSKKPESLIELLLQIANTQPGDIVLDSFLGSGTTTAVAHKMGRRWIGVELGEHAYTHCKVRMDRVIDGEQGGISKTVEWQGGGGYDFYELAPSLINVDKMGMPIISKEYNVEMLAAAMARHENYNYWPDKNMPWKQGYCGESKKQAKNFIFTTTGTITLEYLDGISVELGEDEALLICASSFTPECKSSHKNITMQKIPQILLSRCEYGKTDYNLNVVDQIADFDDEGVD
jgi:adenine-specific DNA-methyltransferase